MKIINLLIVLIISIFTFDASALENCKWNNKKGVPCITISKTPNTSAFNVGNVNKIIITKQDIINSGAADTNDVLKLIPGQMFFNQDKKSTNINIYQKL